MGIKAKLATLGILAIIILAVYGFSQSALNPYKTYIITGTPTDAQLSPTADGGTTFVVWLDTGQKLEIQRSLFYGDNEDDIYRDIRNNLNKPMEFTCWGWQFDWWFIYWYPNIGHVEIISDQ